MFKCLFNKNHSKLSKAEYWEKWEFFSLLEDLHTAEEFLANKTEGHSGEFDSAEKFREALIDEIDWIEFNNKTDLSQIHQWFLPAGVWNGFAGLEGEELGKRILERTSKWKKGTAEERKSS